MEKNKIIIILDLIIHFFKSFFGSIVLFFKHISGSKNIKPLVENRFLDTINFIFHIGPKSFRKKPSGIKIGRSLSTFLNYIFNKEGKFSERKSK